ncbi:hypothetical protein HMPREF9336_01081 [Segniliparus rugosus ATCC BAA-974]|uniref:FG-GAP repeat protein n=1 Tax=Segniliparus rugosus (strain ATCC BAA-974 / DSM 45345 / CCUG 50838 / CIP 108380 / JCM 13579 / CDC 945) TaxID=679197 RepID=E5XNL0_SEGRC|nr:hypothetical protein HMPREF9336_01081 [Segniliparus rugosus ATCC BAA-974]
MSLLAGAAGAAPCAYAAPLPDCAGLRAPQESGACVLRAADGSGFQARWAGVPERPTTADPDGSWHVHVEVEVFGPDGALRQRVGQDGPKPPYLTPADLDGDGRDELLVAMVYGGAGGNGSAEVWHDGGSGYAEAGEVGLGARPTGWRGVFAVDSHVDAGARALDFYRFEGGEVVGAATVLRPFKDGRCEARLGDIAGLGLTASEAEERFCAEASRAT